MAGVGRRPRLKDVTFEKDKLCSACQAGKQVANTHPTKAYLSTSRVLELLVSVLPTGKTSGTTIHSHQRVKLVCVFPFPDRDARKTQRFILVRAREGPTSSGGGEFVLSRT